MAQDAALVLVGFTLYALWLEMESVLACHINAGSFSMLAICLCVAGFDAETVLSICLTAFECTPSHFLPPESRRILLLCCFKFILGFNSLLF